MTELTRRDLLLSVVAGSVAAALPAQAGGQAGRTAVDPPRSSPAPALDGAAAPGPGPRERHAFDDDWRFHLGHADDPRRDFGFGTYQRTYAKAGKDTADAAMADFDDAGWRVLSLPHDWGVELPLVAAPDAPAAGEDPAAGHGYRPLGRGFPETSVGWYRKTLEVPSEDAGRRIVLEFDGVFRDCLVFCNGHIVGANASGYAGFEVDLSDVLDYGKRNVIAVRVDATLGEGWFYEGAGIYRHVWLRKHDPVHVPFGGIAVRCQPQRGQARGSVELTARNDGAQAATATAILRVFDADRRQVAAATLPPMRLEAGGQGSLTHALALDAPRLWSTESPHLYRLVTELRVDGVLRDSVQTPFGVRSVAFDPQQGFLLNGQPLKLKGTCNHQDHAGVGTAIPDALQAWRLQQLRSMGCNALRTSHNPATPELLDLCDSLGMLVIEETRRMSSDPEAMAQLRWMLLRDRNRPSIIAWSLGNEEPQMVTARGVRIVGTMQGLVRRLDPTRQTTFAMDKGYGEGVSQVVDVVGFNYRTNQMDAFHARYPHIPVYGSETGSTVSTRGNYSTDDHRGYARAYDVDHPWWASTAEAWWAFVAERPYIAGGFIWTGFDYRGEPTPYNRWPNVASQFGVLDSCGFPKDNYWYYRAQWTSAPVLHLFPHWNWEGLPESANGMVDVWCHSNLDQVELLVNGISQGRRAVPRHGHVQWRVRYAPGEILARGFRDGAEVLVQRRRTAGRPAAIVLRTDATTLLADGRDVAVIVAEVVDAQGTPVPDASSQIHFSMSGSGRLIGVGNGDPASHEPDQADARRAFNGLCMAIVQTTPRAGTLQIRATSPGLGQAIHALPVEVVTRPAH